MSSEPDSEPRKQRRDPKGWLFPTVIAALVGLITLATWFGVPRWGDMYTKAEAAEHKKASDEVHKDLDQRVTTIERGLGDKLDDFEKLLKDRLPKKR